MSLTYPRVLIVLMSKVKADDPTNLLIRTQFGDWPKEHLAQIHSGETSGEGEFCGRYYRIQAQDRVLGKLFTKLRGEVAGMVAMNAVKPSGGASPSGRWGASWFGKAKKQLGDFLIGSGLWEILFRLRISPEMERFVREFRPDVIYCQGYSLGFATLPLELSRRFGIPICFQTTDDWPHRAYRWSPVRWLIRRRAAQLVRGSAVRMAFGQKMKQEYERRYAVPFEVTYHLDDPSRFVQGAGPSGAQKTIVYTGNLAHRRYEALIDCAAALRMEPKLNAKVLVYTSGIPKDAPAELRQMTELEFRPLPSHTELPTALAGGDVLLLPESFHERREAIELSTSTKAHLYMMSRRPIIVYAPQYSGTLNYAQQGGWAEVRARRDVRQLREAFERLLGSNEIRDRLRERSEQCIQQNHDLVRGRSRFLLLLSGATGTSDAQGSPHPA